MPQALPFIVMGAQVGGALYQGMAANSYSKYEEAQNQFNAKMSDLQARDALERGEKDVSKLRRTGKQVQGSQRVSAAGQGVLVDAGSPGELVDDTRKLVEEDIMTARGNAWREAFGYRVNAANYRIQGKAARQAGKAQMTNTLISGGMGAGATGISAFYGKGK